jgi:hypothetical protein
MLSSGSVSGVASVETRATASGVDGGRGVEGEVEFVEFGNTCWDSARFKMLTSGNRSNARFTANRNVLEFMTTTLPRTDGHRP